mmetsp:Transcript_19476/g.28864  ORF Transcript_19476/g.28864 Transcript_19476/m.28864 type:complete len:313 (+) Transcript_19476:106-1044(+)|eukprot:CAMPEP_0194224918 /NCGR_PEP_ID=MMETSP0156-20130528/38451_1 /TAXON_ID=33649 /ORGANISM="Thalassionema nitzschioides, Strain L26-B" /LENGTH=312 /DNA_ID=CAMNT_0038956665 /DNA_START=85 /DNA_END=1023 /DNA_ORIENTATION=-
MMLFSNTTESSKSFYTSIIKLNSPLSWIVILLATSSTSALATHSSQAAERSFTFGNYLSISPIRHYIPRTKLLYAHEVSETDDEDISDKKSKIHFWLWSNIFPPKRRRPKGRDMQRNVDDYLEFLDHRYHRLHDDEVSAAPPSKRFSALDWLKDTKEPCDQQRATDDALFVLGVAGLASDRLRQRKRYISKPEKHSGTIITTTATTLPSEIGGLFGNLKAKEYHVSSTKLRLQAQRKASNKLHSRKKKQSKLLDALLKLSTKAMIPARAVFEHGGGKKMTALTLSMLTALFLCFRSMISTVGLALGSVFQEA